MCCFGPTMIELFWPLSIGVILAPIKDWNKTGDLFQPHKGYFRPKEDPDSRVDWDMGWVVGRYMRIGAVVCISVGPG